MAKWTGKKSNVMFSKPEEPSFLKKFKEKVGYKEDKGISEKFAEMPKATEEDFEDRDDELPQVVQLKPGDLSQEEFENISKLEEPSTVEKPKEEDDGKIVFRQPTRKRIRDTPNDLKASTKKTKKEDVEEEKEKVEKEEIKKNKKKEKSNRTLLSFDEEDDTEDT